MDDAQSAQRTTGSPSHPTDQTLRRRRISRRSAITLVGLVALFYGAGGWYFSTELGNDAFVVDNSEDDADEDFNLEVVAIDDASIAFRGAAGDDADLAADGVFGVDVPNGWLHVGEIRNAATEAGFDTVTRWLDFSVGAKPDPGTPADFDAWFYETNPSDLGLAYEDITFESPVGQLDGWVIPAADDTWAIVIHGKGAQRREGLRILESINTAGHPALIMSYRNDARQPPDPSGYHRYGATEWTDVEGAVRYAVANGAEDVVLVGLSTGAAHALSFFYQSDLADRVAAAIFDSPNIDFGRTVDFGAGQRTIPLIGVKVPQSLTTVAKSIAALRFDFDWSEHDFIDDAERINFPILVFHGTDDSTVPIDVSERLRDERPDLVTMLSVVGAEHMQSWNADPSRYTAEVEAFLKANG